MQKYLLAKIINDNYKQNYWLNITRVTIKYNVYFYGELSLGSKLKLNCLNELIIKNIFLCLITLLKSLRMFIRFKNIKKQWSLHLNRLYIYIPKSIRFNEALFLHFMAGKSLVVSHEIFYILNDKFLKLLLKK